MEKRKGFEAAVYSGAPIVAMIEFNGTIYVAAQDGVYRREVRDGKEVFEPLVFDQTTPEPVIVNIDTTAH